MYFSLKYVQKKLKTFITRYICTKRVSWLVSFRKDNCYFAETMKESLFSFLILPKQLLKIN